ncbi:MAG: DUF4259 domain-containing protein [Myxococcota bacterium]
MDTPNVPAHSLESEPAKRYFTEWLTDPTFDFIDDTFEIDADDVEEAAEALFAAELVAATTGRPSPAMSEELKAAAKKIKNPSKKTLQRARAAVRAALDPKSPLRAHWAETGIDTTLASVTDLLDRLT